MYWTQIKTIAKRANEDIQKTDGKQQDSQKRQYFWIGVVSTFDPLTQKKILWDAVDFFVHDPGDFPDSVFSPIVVLAIV